MGGRDGRKGWKPRFAECFSIWSYGSQDLLNASAFEAMEAKVSDGESRRRVRGRMLSVFVFVPNSGCGCVWSYVSE